MQLLVRPKRAGKVTIPLTISRSLAKVVATPSYGETHFPDVDAHAASVTTLVPSLFNTASSQIERILIYGAGILDLLSLVSHVPETIGSSQHP